MMSEIKSLGESGLLESRQIAFCPTCKHQLDGFGGVNHEEKPTPGDYTVCISCCEMLVFSKAMTLRKPSVLEIDDMDQEQLSIIADTIKMLSDFKRYQADQNAD